MMEIADQRPKVAEWLRKSILYSVVDSICCCCHGTIIFEDIEDNKALDIKTSSYWAVA